MTFNSLNGSACVDQYQNLKFLSPGGMGNIYTAIDSLTSKIVAVKFIRITTDNANKLLEEFKISSLLSHPNIIETYYYNEISDSTGDYIYSIIEFCSSGSLRNKIKLLQPFPIDTCLKYFYQLLWGLQEAHKYCVHRDLKPENILVSDSGNLKICDFGIARYIDQLTRTNTYKGWGSIPYMSPECWLRETNTIQMDIYSLGIIFFEILVLQQPFKGDVERDIRDQHIFNQLPSLVKLRADVPTTIAEIIRKMTNKKVGDRYRNVDEILIDLNKTVEIQDDSVNIEPILKKAHLRTNAATEAALKKQKAQDDYNDQQKVLNFSIEQLFDQFCRVADKINFNSIDEKVRYTKNIINTNAAASMFTLSFFGKRLTISFYASDIILRYIAHRKSTSVENQLKLYDRVMNPDIPEFIDNDNAILLGKVELNTLCDGRNFGFNVLLKKNAEDIYGEWWVSKFFKSRVYSNVSTERCYFPFDPPEFFYKFQDGRSGAMTLTRLEFDQINDKAITSLIEEMVTDEDLTLYV